MCSTRLPEEGEIRTSLCLTVFAGSGSALGADTLGSPTTSRIGAAIGSAAPDGSTAIYQGIPQPHCPRP